MGREEQTPRHVDRGPFSGLFVLSGKSSRGGHVLGWWELQTDCRPSPSKRTATVVFLLRTSYRSSYFQLWVIFFSLSNCSFGPMPDLSPLLRRKSAKPSASFYIKGPPPVGQKAIETSTVNGVVPGHFHAFWNFRRGGYGQLFNPVNLQPRPSTRGADAQRRGCSAG